MKFYIIPKRRWKKYYDKILEWRRNNPEKISKYNRECYQRRKAKKTKAVT